MIFGYIKGQTLELHYDKIVSESVDYLTAEFNFFTNEWEGFTKWAHFKKSDQVFDVLLEDNKINKNAHLNLSAGEWGVYLHGNSDTGERITTNVVYIKVEPTGVLNGELLPEIPLSVAEQITALAQRAVEVAESVRTDADNGVFDGEQGDDYVLTQHDRNEIAQKATSEIREELKDKADLINGKVPEEQLPDNLLNKDNLQETINEAISQQFDKDKNGQVDKADDTDKLGGKPPEYYAASEDIPTIPKKVSAFQNDAGYLTEHQDLSDYAKKSEIPVKTSQLTNDSGFLTEHQSLEEYAKIADVTENLNEVKSKIPTKTSELENDSKYLSSESDPTVPSWAKQPTKPIYTAQEVGADALGAATNAVSRHNVDDESHSDIRLILSELNAKIEAFLNTDDTTLDQLSEIVAYITNNKTLIDNITVAKVNVLDIINNLTTNVANKPLSASMGVALKTLIDAITVPTKVSELANDANYLTSVPAEYVTETELNSKGYATTSQIPTIPSSLPANGGNADTVDNYHIRKASKDGFVSKGAGWIEFVI